MKPAKTTPSPNLKLWVIIAGECRALADNVITEMGPPKKAHYSQEHLLRLVIQVLTAKISDSFDALVLLCRTGWGVEAGMLLRVLLETAANAAFLAARPKPGLFLYAESTIKAMDDYMTAIQWAERLGGSIPEDVLRRRIAVEQERKEAVEWLASFIGIPPKSDSLAWWQKGKNSGKRRYWGNISIEKRMQLAGMESWYGTIYRLMCTGIHASGGMQSTYLRVEPEPALIIGPKTGWAEMVLPYACQVLLLHFGVVGSVFRIENPDLINAQRERLRKIHEMIRQE